jgi:serine/threonine-protein kinase
VAEHVRLGRKVALKVLRSEFSGNQEAVKRFFAEARSVNCISHENIIEVSDFIENPQGPSFYIMELLRGEDLCALQSREGILPLGRTLPIVLQVCSGLSAAHDAGIIHRDLKPDNIFLVDRAGRPDFVKLLDFGVAKLMNATVDDASTFRSSVGMVVGTPDYMAPEQALGHAVDHRVDVYALGVILFEMVAGRRPFVAKTAREVMVQHLTASVPRPSRLNPAGRIPEALEKLILACLAKNPERRPQSIKELEQRLRTILDQLPTPADAAAAARSSARRRHRSLRLALGAALLLAFAGATSAIRDGGPLASAASFDSRAAKARAPRSAFTIEPIDTTIPAPIIVGLPHVSSTSASASASPSLAPPSREPAPAFREAALRAEKTVRKAPTLPAPTVKPPTEGSPFHAQPHTRLNRDMILDPYE